MFWGGGATQLALGINTVITAAVTKITWSLLPNEIRFIFSSLANIIWVSVPQSAISIQ
jgi:hypothetical protein